MRADPPIRPGSATAPADAGHPVAPRRRLTRRGLLRRALGAAALPLGALPPGARAQQPGLPVIGYLCAESPGPFASRVRAFREGLAQSGFVEGQSVAIVYRWAEGHYDRLPALAAELAGLRVDVLVAPGGAPAALAAKAATTSIPVVFEMGGDPVGLGVVASLSRPEGNVTGVTSLSVEASLKRFELLREVLPAARSLAAVINPTSPTAASQLARLQAAAAEQGGTLPVLQACREKQLDAVFAALPALGAGGLVFASDPFFAFRSEALAARAARSGVAAITQSRDFPIAGGLMSYGGDFMQSHREAGSTAGRILKGERPSRLPVQQVTRLELFVNLNAARRMRLAMPATILARADEVIE